MRAPAVLLALILSAAPVAADDSVLSYLARKLDRAAMEGGYAAGLAACLLGKGDAKATVELFTKKGWTAEHDTEMGLIYLSAPTGDFGGMLGEDGTFCEVASESVGTPAALPQILPVLVGAGMGNQTGTNDIGCTTFPVASGAVVVLNSTGQDPVCDSETTSAARVVFGG